MGERTVSNIIHETCQAIFVAMKEQYLKVGNTYCTIDIYVHIHDINATVNEVHITKLTLT